MNIIFNFISALLLFHFLQCKYNSYFLKWLQGIYIFLTGKHSQMKTNMLFSLFGAKFVVDDFCCHSIRSKMAARADLIKIIC